MYYIAIISLTDILTISLNLAFAQNTPSDFIIKIISTTLISTAAVIAIDGLFALIIRRGPLPKSWFRADSPAFKVSDGERRFYRTIKLNKWKNTVPELGFFTGFSKSKFTDRRDKEYLARFLAESNYGVAIHLINAFDGFLLLSIPYVSYVPVVIPIITVNFVLSLLPAMILRYNTPVLLKLYKKQ